ncbi:MAG: class I SAM-dependent methyltransferase [Elusimicrobia bacterium]|nr:class I SAM-dependent methyltransferase [Elusimicrobiota bacterium]
MLFKEDDIRPKALMAAKEALLEEDKEFLRSRRSEFVQAACPACGSGRSESWAEKEGFSYHVCRECRTVFMNPRACEELMRSFYQRSKNYAFWNKHIYPASEAVRREKIMMPRARRVVACCEDAGLRGGTLLEVGAAFGTFCGCVRELGFFRRVIAVEPTADLAEACRGKGLETLQTSFEGLELPASSVDAAVSFEVIEHLFSPAAFLERCGTFLKKGGLLVCTTPNIDALGTLVLKEKAKVVDHEHVNYFNPESLAALFERTGFEPLEVATPGELDVELLMNALAEDAGLRESHPFFSRLLLRPDEAAQAALQELLKKSRLSSHMWIVGRKR